MNESLLSEAEAYLVKSDPILGAIITKQTLVSRTNRSDYFTSLCRSIIGQQVSVAAASAIFKRFKEHTNLDPANTLKLSDEDSKAIGLSKQKLSYVMDLAEHFVKDPTIYNHLEKQSDQAVIDELVAVKGIGPWTAQMFLMSTLHRPDVFAPDDVGLQRAMMLIYKWETLPAKKDLAAFAERWSPYRTIASFHLWQSLNNDPNS